MPVSEIQKYPVAELARCLLQKAKPCAEEYIAALGTSVRRVCDAIHAQALVVIVLDPASQHARFQTVYFSPALYGTDEAKRRALQEKARAMLVHPINCCTRCEVCELVGKGKTAERPPARFLDKCSQELCALTGLHIVSLHAVPIRLRGATVGSVEAVNKIAGGKAGAAFAPEDAGLLQDLADGAALAMHRATCGPGEADERQIAIYVARVTRLKYAPLGTEFHPDLALFRQIGDGHLQRYRIVPLEAVGAGGMRVAVANPFDLHALQDFETVTGCESPKCSLRRAWTSSASWSGPRRTAARSRRSPSRS
jgi:hypothetical protein